MGRRHATTPVKARSTDARRPRRSPRSEAAEAPVRPGGHYPRTLLDAPIELPYSDHGPIELSRELLEPARESRHVLDASAGWMLRPHKLQLRRLPAQLAHRRRCIGNVQIIGLPVGGHPAHRAARCLHQPGRRRRCRLRPWLRSKIQCRQHHYHRDRDGRKDQGHRPPSEDRHTKHRLRWSRSRDYPTTHQTKLPLSSARAAVISRSPTKWPVMGRSMCWWCRGGSRTLTLTGSSRRWAAFSRESPRSRG